MNNIGNNGSMILHEKLSKSIRTVINILSVQKYYTKCGSIF